MVEVPREGDGRIVHIGSIGSLVMLFHEDKHRIMHLLLFPLFRGQPFLSKARVRGSANNSNHALLRTSIQIRIGTASSNTLFKERLLTDATT